jgi:hypothetical protein
MIKTSPKFFSQTNVEGIVFHLLCREEQLCADQKGHSCYFDVDLLSSAISKSPFSKSVEKVLLIRPK